MATPKLRFDGFSGNWVTTQLGNVCSFTQGVQIPQSEQINEERDGYIRYLYIRDFFSDKFKCYVPNIYPEKIIHPHEIMMVNTGNTTGEAYTGRYGVLSNNSFKISYDLAHFNDQFMYLFCSSELAQNQIKKFFNAGGQPHLGHKNISQILISYPKKEEQTKIASFLSAVDEKISQLTQKHALLSQYKQGMMQKLFSQQIRFKADDGSAFGEWEEILVQYLVDKGILEKPMDGNHGEIHPTSKDYVEEGIPFVMATDIFNGKLHLEQTKKLTKQQADSLKKGFSREGDVLLTHKANIGNVAIVPQLDVEYLMLTPQVTYYRVINFSRLNNNFLKVYFESPQFQKNLLDLCTGATRLYIGISEQRKLPISLPCLEEQTKIANLLSAIDQKIEVVAQQIEQAKTWKKGLLQQMFI